MVSIRPTSIGEAHRIIVQMKGRIEELEHWFNGYRTPELSMAAMLARIDNLSLTLKQVVYTAKQRKTVTKELRNALEEAIAGIEWYIAEYPLAASEADNEFLTRAKKALKESK